MIVFSDLVDFITSHVFFTYSHMYFLLFLAPAVGSNPAGRSLNLNLPPK